jgi:hypothetical protein
MKKYAETLKVKSRVIGREVVPTDVVDRAELTDVSVCEETKKHERKSKGSKKQRITSRTV